MAPTAIAASVHSALPTASAAVVRRAPAYACRELRAHESDASPSASKQQRLLHQTDKQLLRLFRRVRDGLVDAGLHKTARRIERRGRKGVVDDP